MRARLEEARTASEATASRAATQLARWLASRDRDLDEAVELGIYALRFGEDAELRREVSAWLESLGDAARAAAMLEPIASAANVEREEAAYILLRAGILRARAADGSASAEALVAAGAIDPTDAFPLELLAGLSAWSPAALSPSAAAQACVEAARRRTTAGQESAALDDLWRAVAVAPSSDVAAAALSARLERDGRHQAADEVWRALVRILPDGDERRRQIGAMRSTTAAQGVDGPAHALGVALDLSLDSVLDGEQGATFDAVLLDVGLLEAVAARLEARAGRAHVPLDRARQLVELGRLCGGPLADGDRAAAAFVSALAANPASEEAFVELRALVGDRYRSFDGGAGERGPDPLVAVVRSVAATESETERRAQLVARLSTALPHLAKDSRVVDDGSDTRAATARAWTAAAMGSDDRALATALERVATTAPPPVRAVLLAVAAERYSAAGDRDAARRTATLAAEADGGSARCATTLADALATGGDRAAVAALDRAVAIVGPRATWCSALGQALGDLGDGDQAFAWLRRSVDLCPGNQDAVNRLLGQLVRAGDASRLAETLAWVLSEPQPTGWLAEPFAAALRQLARLEPERGAVVARRALDVLGPKVPAVREAMLHVAHLASDDAFAAAVLERWLSSVDEGTDRRALFATLADLRQRLGDTEGEARIVARAVREGLSSETSDARLDRLGAPENPDALLWVMGARAESLDAAGPPVEAAQAWRTLGAALWDLAGDRGGAIAAWLNAAHAGPIREHTTFVLDLVAFAGIDFAFDYVAGRIANEPDSATAAGIAADAARAALSVGQRHIAFDMAARGVARSPAHAGALELAERAADGAAGVDELSALSDLYELVALRALGRFGRRAAHYRGARFFDRAGQHELALKHAALAFRAVPTEGSSFQLLARAAERAGDRAHAVRTVEQVAERFDRADMRSSWLLRAASIAGTGEEASRRKVDVLLRATVGAPSVATVALLRDAAHELLRYGPEERDIVEMRVSRAARAILEHLDGPEGARVAIALATTSLDLFEDATGALASFERAFACDPDIDEFAQLAARGPALAAAPDARERLAVLLTSAETLHSNAGVPALRVLASMASALDDTPLRARAAVALARRDPDDEALVVEADAAARSFPELGERLAQRVDATRRADALVALARARAGGGAHEDAARLLERAADLVDGARRADVERELRVALDAAGRSAEIDARVQQEAGDDVTSPAIRADRWSEVAERREARGDVVGAVQALLEACKLDPESLERWSKLERVAQIGGDENASVTALEQIARRVEAAGRSAAYKRLARAHERRTDFESAESVWKDVLALDEDDEEADHAVESAMAARGQYDELVHHLARRASRLRRHSGSPERLRAVRLRRAAILEQRLGRDDEACDELALLLDESPNNVGALRYLADLFERQGKYAQAAPLWRRAAAVEADREKRDDLELRAGRAARAAGDAASALEHARRVLARHPSSVEALALRVDASRAVGGDSELGDALEAGAAVQADAATRSTMLMEAAQAAARAGDPVRALQRAQRAAAEVPEGATAQLLARGLEYRVRGAGAPDEARRTIEDLGRITEPLHRDDAALRAFLLAEALETVEGGGAGLRELEAVRSTVGAHPLVSLGIAERLAAKGHHAPAVDAYRAALQGSLLDLRKPGSVAVTAADTAIQANRLLDAQHFLDVAELHEEAVAAAHVRRSILRELEARARLQTSPGERNPQESTGEFAATPGEVLALHDLEAAVRAATTPGERARARLALGRARLQHDDLSGAEPLLWEALADGLIEAGDVLAPLIAPYPDRAPDLVRLRRQQATIDPGDLGRLESLRAAALADEDRVYARAIEHVLRAFDPGAGPLPPPPLSAQPEQPGILALLVRPSMDASGEALGLLWEGAMQLFVRDAASYGITGVERVVPGPSSTIARLYEASMRVLAPPRIPLFLSRSTVSASSAHIALLAPPSVVLIGDVREESPELRFTLGRGMSAALAQNVLRMGLPPAEGRAVVDALRAAFGPPEIGRRVDPPAARLAESFWHIVPARTQRRLQEMLRSAANLDYEQLLTSAQQSGRRVGMFLAGDLACAARVLVAESVPRLQGDLVIDNIRHLCEELPLLADLIRLAVSREYADARWHAAAPTPPRGARSTGRFNLF